jgi:acetyl-CoA C-acetyltransferase
MSDRREVVICEPVRTAIGGYGGMFKSVTAVELGVAALVGLLSRAGVAAEAIDDVIVGQCNGGSEAPAAGRVVALDAGLPITTGGYNLDRRCGSGLQAILNAVMQVATRGSDVVVAGGIESMSNAIFYSTDLRWGGAHAGVRVHDALVRARATVGGRAYPVPGGMIETAENLRRQYGISRDEQDRLALQSHQRAIAAQKNGILADEIVPVLVRSRAGEEEVCTDEHPRADASLEAMAGLKPLLIRQDPDATVTAGNASGQNDAAALCLVTTREYAEAEGLTPLVRLVSWANAGVPPNVMGISPVHATARALERARLEMSDLDVIELNEAFAAQALAVVREWRVDPFGDDRLNPYGSGISLGHPVGATGARMLGSMARELHRRGGRFGLTTMCIGGGQGLAAIWERM